MYGCYRSYIDQIQPYTLYISSSVYKHFSSSINKHLTQALIDLSTIHYTVLPFVQILQPRHSNGDFIFDFCDGILFKSNSHFQQYPDALQVVAYFDEVEVCNPLAGHACP